MRETPRQISEIVGFFNEGGIGEKHSAYESISYRKTVVGVMKEQNEMYPAKESMRFRTAEKESVLNPVDTSGCRTLETRVCQRMLRTCADSVCWKEHWPELMKSCAGFV